VAVATFLGDLLEHFLVQQQLGNEQLEALDLGLQCPDAPGRIDLGGGETLAPAVRGMLADTELAADIGDREALRQVAVGFPQWAGDLFGGPSLCQESLLDLLYPARTLISPGPTFGGQTMPWMGQQGFHLAAGKTPPRRRG
jgi:hypothetical protein